MKLNIDAEPKDMGVALNVAFLIMQANPNQETGTKGQVAREANGLLFVLTRNDDSHTIEVVYE